MLEPLSFEGSPLGEVMFNPGSWVDDSGSLLEPQMACQRKSFPQCISTTHATHTSVHVHPAHAHIECGQSCSHSARNTCLLPSSSMFRSIEKLSTHLSRFVVKNCLFRKSFLAFPTLLCRPGSPCWLSRWCAFLPKFLFRDLVP